MFQSLLILVLCNYYTIQTLECYYCNDEDGHYCPRPFPLKSMFKNIEKYHEQMKNIAITSINEPIIDTIVNCFKTDYFNRNYQYQNSYRGVMKTSMNNSILCQSNYRLSVNPNYPGWEKTVCCYSNRCNQAVTNIKQQPIFILFIIYISIFCL